MRSDTIINQRKVEATSRSSDAARLSYKFAKLRHASCDIECANVFVVLCTAEARAAASGRHDAGSAVLPVLLSRPI